MNDAGTPTSPYGATEIAPKPYSETPAPECRPDVNPRPEAWNPGVPNYPWWKLNFAAPPPPDRWPYLRDLPIGVDQGNHPYAR